MRQGRQRGRELILLDRVALQTPFRCQSRSLPSALHRGSHSLPASARPPESPADYPNPWQSNAAPARLLGVSADPVADFLLRGEHKKRFVFDRSPLIFIGPNFACPRYCVKRLHPSREAFEYLANSNALRKKTRSCRFLSELLNNYIAIYAIYVLSFGMYREHISSPKRTPNQPMQRDFASNSFEMISSEKRHFNPFRISSSGAKNLKSSRISTSKKHRG